MRLFNRFYSSFDVLLLLGDIVLTITVAVGTRFFIAVAVVYDEPDWVKWIVIGSVVASIIIVSFYYSDLYIIDQILSKRELLLHFATGFGIACLIIGSVSYSIQEAGSQNIYLIQMLILGLGLLAWRLGFVTLIRKAKIRGKLLILGMQTIGRLVSEELWRQKHLGLEVVGFVGADAGQLTLSYGNPRRVCLPVFARDSILAVVEATAVNRILVAEGNGNFPGEDLVALRLRGIPIEDCHTFYERLMSKICITDLHPGWIARSKGFHRTRWVIAAKRVIDVIVSALGLALAAPVTLVTAIAIKLDSAGPVLYRQERVGQNERPFTLYKFRSMTDGAEVRTGPVWATESDPRVTRVGRIIRKLRIDEIPQVLNVLKGEMSFVGPRPERPFFVSALNAKIPYYHLRFSVKPGLTGWAQVSYPYGDSEEDAIQKLQYDLYYVKNMSPMFDLQILFETVKVILLGKGAQ
jgi:sugar transferase (PEP-CTERM system associated)